MAEFLIIFAVLSAVLFFGFNAMNYIWQEAEKDKKKDLIFIKVEGHDTTIEVRLRILLAKCSWAASGINKQIIVVDCGADEETKKILELFIKENRYIGLCSLPEADKYIKRSGLKGTVLDIRG